MSKTESNGTELSVELIQRAMKAFKEFDYQPQRSTVLPPLLYDKAVEQGYIDPVADSKNPSPEFVRRIECPRKNRSSTVTMIQERRKQDIGRSIKAELIKNTSVRGRPSISNFMNHGNYKLSTKGKTWKWGKDAKRKWSWSEEKKKNQWCFKYDGDKRILKYFKWMWGRCIKANRNCDFPRTQQGFNEFCKEIGPIPENMKRPSVGRKFHNKGYVYGNIVWERYEYNVWKNRRTEEEVHNTKEEDSNEIPF